MPANNPAHRAIPVGHSAYTTDDSYSSKRKLVDDDTVDTLVASSQTPTSSYHSSPVKLEARGEPKVSVTAGHRESYMSDTDDLEMQKIGQNCAPIHMLALGALADGNKTLRPNHQNSRDAVRCCRGTGVDLYTHSTCTYRHSTYLRPTLRADAWIRLSRPRLPGRFASLMCK
ncbi:hypothetical protein LTR95_019026 [Oleoguttula sp. CCFEE 5521]